MKTQEEILIKIDEANELNMDGGMFHGMTYEEGVSAALEWVIE